MPRLLFKSMMQPRCCKYFLLSVLLVQSMVIIWLVCDITTGGSHDETVTKVVLETRHEPHAHRPPLTVRDLLAEEDPDPPTDAESTTLHSKQKATSIDVVATKKVNLIHPTAKSTSKKPKTEPKTNRKTVDEQEQLIEKLNLPSRTLSEFEAAGNNIMITIRTTRKFHQKRLPYMYETWLTAVNGSNVFLVTDAEDEEYQEKSKRLGMHYKIISCGQDYSRWSLCCKSGEEMALMHKPENRQYDWFCHLDDDIYIILKNLINLFAKLDPSKPLYMGRAGNHWKKPRSLSKKQTWIKDKTRKFSFAVGGMYCLSRAMLDKVKPWIGDGNTMGATCNKFLEPEDVTVGSTVELLANEMLSRTKLFHPHGLILSRFVNPRTLKDQIGFAYGCGQLCAYKGYRNNAIKVPSARFPFKKDPSRFKSLHCHLYPDASLCRPN